MADKTSASDASTGPNKFIQFAGPILAIAAHRLAALDEDDTGADDLAAHLLLYGSGVLDSVSNGEDLPPLPVDIQAGVAGKLSTSAKLALGIAGDVLSVVQFSVSGKARIAFKYISQVLMALTTGSSVPPAPVALKTK